MDHPQEHPKHPTATTRTRGKHRGATKIRQQIRQQIQPILWESRAVAVSWQGRRWICSGSSCWTTRASPRTRRCRGSSAPSAGRALPATRTCCGTSAATAGPCPGERHLPEPPHSPAPPSQPAWARHVQPVSKTLLCPEVGFEWDRVELGDKAVFRN